MKDDVDGMDARYEQPQDLLEDVLRRSIVVAALAIPVLVACWRLSAHRPLGALSFAIYVAVAALLAVSEHRVPFQPQWGSAIRGSRTDVIYVVVASLMDKAMFLLCVTAVASIGSALASRLGLGLWPTDWGLGWQVALALLIADAGTYLRHRLSHGLDVLWRFHRVHHSMTELYWIRSAYTHPVEQFLILTAIMLPISLLGAGEQVVAVVAFAFGLSGLLQHANVDARSSVLNWVFATPEVHRTHHAADERSLANFSAFFVVMDLLFGTYRRPAPAGTPLRVGLDEPTPFPKDFWSHLTIPFRSTDVSGVPDARRT
jgi:sterol desaturase/sphingolipid hydroxylase (fatty acid hydroxylase superfamily)